MSDTPSHDNLIERLNEGVESAADQLDDRYRSQLRRLVEGEMDRRFRRREDAEDVVQSAFRTFYRRNSLGEFRIDSAADLWQLLATITRRKILKHVEKLEAGKRSLRREEQAEGDELRGAEPTPEEVAIAADLMEKTAEGLDELSVQVFHRRLQKCTEEEIALELGCSRALVRTKLKRIRQRLERLAGDKSDVQPPS